MKKLARRSRVHRSTFCVVVSQVWLILIVFEFRSLNTPLIEEFSIYMNYVRKLGFEESPDYGFLRDLFLKVLKNIGETDDRMFDWCLLNNGKGWEYGSVSDTYS